MEPLTTKEIRQIVESGDRDMIKQIDPEDLEMFYENEGQRTLYSPEGIKNLYLGICRDAVHEYKSAHAANLFSDKPCEKTSREKELEMFFGSDFFKMVSGLRNADQAIEHIENTMIEERKKRLSRTMISGA